MNKFSTQKQFHTIAKILRGYIKIPLATDSIPGSFMETVLGNVRSATILNTYDFIDVYNPKDRIGWQVKSTKETTPVTWKRAKVKDSERLIKDSQKSASGVQVLGDAIIDFCNQHVKESIERYKLDEVYYSRLVLFESRQVLYFERLLCTKEKPLIFDKKDFAWKWSAPKTTVKKEQLPALHGKNIRTNTKWFAWHGLGENQLHFSGEKEWWPAENDKHSIRFAFPSEKERLTQNEFISLLQRISK